MLITCVVATVEFICVYYLCYKCSQACPCVHLY